MSRKKFDLSTLNPDEKIGLVDFDLVALFAQEKHVLPEEKATFYFNPNPYQVVFKFKVNHEMLQQDSLVVYNVTRSIGVDLPFQNPSHKSGYRRAYKVITVTRIIPASQEIEDESLIKSLTKEIIYGVKRSEKIGYINVGRKPLSKQKGKNSPRTTVTLGNDLVDFFKGYSDSGNLSEGIRKASEELRRAKSKNNKLTIDK